MLSETFESSRGMNFVGTTVRTMQSRLMKLLLNGRFLVAPMLTSVQLSVTFRAMCVILGNLIRTFRTNDQ